jgi:hypothetical protein
MRQARSNHVYHP